MDTGAPLPRDDPSVAHLLEQIQQLKDEVHYLREENRELRRDNRSLLAQLQPVSSPGSRSRRVAPRYPRDPY